MRRAVGLPPVACFSSSARSRTTAPPPRPWAFQAGERVPHRSVTALHAAMRRRRTLELDLLRGVQALRVTVELAAGDPPAARAAALHAV